MRTFSLADCSAAAKRVHRYGVVALTVDGYLVEI